MLKALVTECSNMYLRTQTDVQLWDLLPKTKTMITIFLYSNDPWGPWHNNLQYSGDLREAYANSTHWHLFLIKVTKQIT